MLRAAGIEEPAQHDRWVDFIGLNFKQLPIIGTVGESERKKRE